MKKLFVIFAVVFFGIVIYVYSTNQKTPSAVDAPLLSNQEGLPEIVEVKRQAIYKAAMEKNYDKLAEEAERVFSYSFGGSEEGGFISHLKANRNNENGEIFDIISKLLELPYGQQGDYYSWPSVFIKESKDWTDEDIAQMKILLTDQEIESYREFGGYAYYRIGITKEGKWVYFIAGD